MEFTVFLLVGVALYFASDRILDHIETARGQRFENRSVVYFAILLGMTLVVFPIIRWLLAD